MSTDTEMNREVRVKMQYNLVDYEKIYSLPYDEVKIKWENKMKAKTGEIVKKLKKSKKEFYTSWLNLLNDIEKSSKERISDFWNKIANEFGSSSSSALISVLTDQQGLNILMFRLLWLKNSSFRINAY
jgi:hypothetical protein